MSNTPSKLVGLRLTIYHVVVYCIFTTGKVRNLIELKILP